MAEKSELIDIYIEGIVEKYKPKNEEVIHSGVFLVSSKDGEVQISDWQHNGFSVISETVTRRMQELCKKKKVSFCSEGKYSITRPDGKITLAKEISKIREKLQKTLSEYPSISKLLSGASSEFKRRNGVLA